MQRKQVGKEVAPTVQIPVKTDPPVEIAPTLRRIEPALRCFIKEMDAWIEQFPEYAGGDARTQTRRGSGQLGLALEPD